MQQSGEEEGKKGGGGWTKGAEVNSWPRVLLKVLCVPPTQLHPARLPRVDPE